MYTNQIEIARVGKQFDVCSPTVNTILEIHFIPAIGTQQNNSSFGHIIIPGFINFEMQTILVAHLYIRQPLHAENPRA